MLPGQATFRNLSRYSTYHERSLARGYERPFDFVSLNKAAIDRVVPPENQQALVIDASFIPKSGAHTYGLERFWNSRHRRSEKGLEVSAIAVLDITDNCAYGLSIEQTLATSDKTAEAQGTRIDAYLEQLRGVVVGHDLTPLRYVITDGYYSKRKFLIEFLFRDAKQFTSLSGSQARARAKLHFHFNASLSALTLGKLEARQQRPDSPAGFSMASVKRRAFNEHLMERISEHLAQGHSLDKSSSAYEALCNYGTITDMAA